ncbi:hypothetical protein ACH47B_31530 [Rhodococcus sp. NPDC019627]|uniref:hypothetical protein n=1 Tax=unclassified Rhodococcus (in: high G+C Gram-positive bacteria) TaxID=192944 RepID=UPI0034032C06
MADNTPRAEETPSRDAHRDAVARVREASGFTVQLPLLGRVPVPRPEQLAFFAAIGLLAAVEIIEWPVALTIAAGHILIADQHNRAVQEIGEVLEAV